MFMLVVMIPLGMIGGAVVSVAGFGIGSLLTPVIGSWRSSS